MAGSGSLIGMGKNWWGPHATIVRMHGGVAARRHHVVPFVATTLWKKLSPARLDAPSPPPPGRVIACSPAWTPSRWVFRKEAGSCSDLLQLVAVIAMVADLPSPMSSLEEIDQICHGVRLPSPSSSRKRWVFGLLAYRRRHSLSLAARSSHVVADLLVVGVLRHLLHRLLSPLGRGSRRVLRW
ncbi:hypothetical protein ACLOJK_029473, partial [Asimina triloba]